MASNETILAWKAELSGADTVRDGLRKINEEVKANRLEQRDANKVIQTAIKDTRNFRAEQNLLNRSFLSTHPNLQKLTQSFSTMAHVARTGLSIANSLNLMWIRQGQNKQTLAELTYSATLAEREYLDTIKKFGPDSREAREALEKWNIEKSKAEQFKSETASQGWLDIASNIFMVILAGNQLLEVFKKFPQLTAIILPLLTNPFIAIPALALAAGFAISEFFKSLSPELRKWHEDSKIILDDFFLIQIPMALGAAAEFLTNFFLVEMPRWGSEGLKLLSDAFVATWNTIISTTNMGVNAVIDGVNAVINGAISAINSFIIAINRILSKAKLGTIALIPKFDGIPKINIPMIKAATGFSGMVNKPTVFLAGEAGPESVSISPNGGKGGGITVVVNVQGSILTERELFRRVDENLKNELKKRNFRLLQ